MKVYQWKSKLGLTRFVQAERVMGKSRYRSDAVVVRQHVGIKETVHEAVESLHNRHGRQLPLKVGQVKTGGQN